MKPISVRFRGFGPYLHEQVIDFERLERGGLFLICGDTGSGKTTVLDAMCCALYGESSGGTRGSFEVMRCKTASREDNTFVELVFDHAGKRYKFVRELKYARKNLNDYHNCMVLADGVYVPLLENPTKNAVTRQAVSILGLTVSQFRQVIILPQGQFETLLISDSAEKEKILTSIFDADRWDRLAQYIATDVRTRDTALKAEAAALETLWTRYGCDGVPTMEALLAQRQELVEAYTADVKEKETAYAKEQQQLESMIAVEQAFLMLDERQRQYEVLFAAKETLDAEEICLQRAEAAELSREMYDRCQTSRAAAQKADEQVTQAVTAHTQATEACETVAAALALHEQQEETVQQLRREAVVLEEKRPLYEQLPSLREALHRIEEEWQYAQESVTRANELKAVSEATLLTRRAEQSEAMTACEQAEERYFHSIGGILASTLTQGQPCPVCGSTTHPAPTAMDTEGMTEEQFKEYKERRAAAIAAFDQAQTAYENAAKAAFTKEEHCRRIGEQVRNQRREWQTALEARVTGIDTAAQLKERLAQCERVAATYEETTGRLKQDVFEAQTAVVVCERLVQERKETAAQTANEARDANAAWYAALEASVFDSEEAFAAARLEPEVLRERKTILAQKQAALAHAKEELERQRAVVENAERPPIEEFKELHKQAGEALDTVRRDLTLATSERDALAKDIAQATQRLARYRDERLRTDADMEFSRRIAGSSGISLKRYVLGVMLSNIAAQANHLLENVYGGRYRLYRTDDIAGSGHKGGLELEVLDSQNNERRSVTTLSGGEKFLVALSLAIGLSAVVQAQGSGVRLEAMFVDEGFGSLSHEAVGDALDILQGVQKSNGIVGIISHVDKLVQAIPNRIEISKTPDGSECRVICNV